MPADIDLPPQFVAQAERVAASYLEHDDPRLQSGFGGGAERWEAERRPILEAVEQSGTVLDVGCANGHLLECLVAWASAAGYRLEPFGVDRSAPLVALARRRLPDFADNFFVGDAWSWSPPRRFSYVYSLADVVPGAFLERYLQRLLDGFIEPGGALIVGSYGSCSRRERPLPLAELLCDYGIPVHGTACAGPDDIVSFVWSRVGERRS